MANIRKGDTVQVIAGKDKGTTGTVLQLTVFVHEFQLKVLTA